MTDYSKLTPQTAYIVEIRWEDIYFCDNWGEDDESVQPVESLTHG